MDEIFHAIRFLELYLSQILSYSVPRNLECRIVSFLFHDSCSGESV